MTSDSAPKKSSPISLPFLFFFVAIVGIAYFAGPWIMTQFMYMQEQSIAARGMVNNDGNGDQSTMPGDDLGNSRRGAPGPPGTFDPDAAFARRDTDKNGILMGNEISERLMNRMEELDTDQDGAISKEEFLAGMPKAVGPEGPPANANTAETTPTNTPATNDAAVPNDAAATPPNVTKIDAPSISENK
jgi:hypothetical protein